MIESLKILRVGTSVEIDSINGKVSFDIETESHCYSCSRIYKSIELNDADVKNLHKILSNAIQFNQMEEEE